MADTESIRQRIVSSVFTKLTDEKYTAHIKIWEEASADEGGRKPRYIIISRTSPLLQNPPSPFHARLLQRGPSGRASYINRS